MWSKSRLNWVELNGESNTRYCGWSETTKARPESPGRQTLFELITWSELRASNNNKQLATDTVHVTRAFINRHSALRFLKKDFLCLKLVIWEDIVRHLCYRGYLRWWACEWKQENCGALVIIFRRKKFTSAWSHDRKIKSPNDKYNTLQTTQLDYLSWL